MKSLEIAFEYLKLGLFVLPIKHDGSKEPSAKSWKFYSERLPSFHEVQNWFQNEQGIAIVGGRISGGLEIIDFEAEDVFQDWLADIERDHPSLIPMLVISKTPGSKHQNAEGKQKTGRHVFYRVESGIALKCQKLAKDGAGKLLIELKGDGGYVIVPGGHPKAHPSGQPYEFLQGDFSAIPVISEEIRDSLIASAQALNCHVDPVQEYRPHENDFSTGYRPGDHFNAQADWSFLLSYGWQLIRQHGNYRQWRRPNKFMGSISATTGNCKGRDGTDRLYVFSSNASPFEAGKCYSPFYALSLLKHAGDCTATARELIETGKASTEKPNGFIVNSVKQFQHNGVLKGSNEIPNNKSESNTIELWQEPTPLNAPIVPHFPCMLLPSLMMEYCLALAESTQTPPDLAIHLSIANHAAALAGRIRVVRTTDHIEPLNLWTLTALESGNRKSAVFREVFAATEQAEAELGEEAKPRIAEAKQQKRMMLKEKDLAEKMACKIDEDPKERASARQRAMEFARQLEDFVVPAVPRLTADDCTTEQLAKMLAANQGRLLIASPEPSFIENCTGRYSEDVNCEVYLQGHAGDAIRVDRVNRDPLIVRDPRLSIGCAIQNSALSGLGKHQDLRGRGFLARFLYSIPISLIGSRLIDTQPIPANLKQKYYQLSLSMWKAQIAFKGGRLFETDLFLSGEAREAWLSLSSQIERRMADDEDLTNLRDWASKLPGAVLRVAGVLHVIENTINQTSANDPISGFTMDRVCKMAIDYWLPHAKAAFELMFGNPKVVLARKLLKKLINDPRCIQLTNDHIGIVSRREMHRAILGSCPQVSDVDPVISLLQDHGYLIPNYTNTPNGRGRPKELYAVNPYFLKTVDNIDKNPSQDASP